MQKYKIILPWIALTKIQIGHNLAICSHFMQYKWSIIDEWAKITSYQRNWRVFLLSRGSGEIKIHVNFGSSDDWNILRVETLKWNIEIFHWDVSTRTDISISRDKFHLMRCYFCEFGDNTTFVLLVSNEKQNWSIFTEQIIWQRKVIPYFMCSSLPRIFVTYT